MLDSYLQKKSQGYTRNLLGTLWGIITDVGLQLGWTNDAVTDGANRRDNLWILIIPV